MLGITVLQAGTLRRAAEGVAIHHRNELLDILTEPFFWGFVIFILICVGIYSAVKDKD